MLSMFDMSDEKMSGFELAALQSEEYADQVIRTFKSNYEDGDDPNDLLTVVANGLGITDRDLFPESKRRIENEIKNYLMRY